MFCRKCGQEIRQGTRFCVKCGTPVPQMQGQTEQKPQMQGQTEQKPQMQGQPEQKPQMKPQPEQSPRPQVQVPTTTKKSGKGSGIIIVLICVIILLLLAIAGLGGYYFYMNSVKEEQDVTDNLDDRDEDEIKEKKPEATESIVDTEEVQDTQIEDVTVPETVPVEETTEVLAEEKPHTYHIVVKDVTWTEAYQEAKAIPNGYLVNIDTEEEWNTILQQIQAEQKEECIFWIGATRQSYSEEYYWVDKKGNFVGDSLNGNRKWLPGEPTFYDGENDMEEYYVDMFFSKSENRWVWNDTPNDLISLISYYSGKVAYIVEIENE